MNTNKSSPTRNFSGAFITKLITPSDLKLISGNLVENEEPYPSLSDYHDYEPNLEFDDSELHQSPDVIVQTGII